MMIFLLFLAACTAGDSHDSVSGLQVLVSISPQKYFVEKIAGELVNVTVLIPPGASPAAFELSPSDMRTVSEADIWFSIGVIAEREWAEEFTGLNPDLLMVNTVEGIEMLPIDRDSHEHDHQHGDTDPHVWLSPEMVKLQVMTIADAMISADPVNGEIFRENAEEFLSEIEELQGEIHQLLDPCPGRSIMVFHPSWGYFADEFNLVQVSIESAGSEPSPGEMVQLLEYARLNSIRAVFVSPQFSRNAAETIAQELNVEVVVIDPLAEDWLENMFETASAICEVLN